MFGRARRSRLESSPGVNSLLRTKRSPVSARRLFLVSEKGRELLIWAAVNFCFTCQKIPAAQRSRWGPLRQRSPAQLYSATLIPAEPPHSQCSKEARAYIWIVWGSRFLFTPARN